jgi:parafibromin
MTEQDFSFALKLFNEHILKPEAQKTKSAAAPPVDTSSGSNGKDGRDGKSKKHRAGEAPAVTGGKRATAANGKTSSTKDSRPPIIIVPSALSGIISSMNAADFLENSTYVTIEEKRKAGAPREKERYISRILSGGVRSKYLLIDNPKLSPKDWERVVAVFATGQSWQFKDWPAGFSNPVELFSKVRKGLQLMV